MCTEVSGPRPRAGQWNPPMHTPSGLYSLCWPDIDEQGKRDDNISEMTILQDEEKDLDPQKSLSEETCLLDILI